MRAMPEFIVLAAILLGIAGGGVTYFLSQSVWFCIAAALGAIFSAAFLLDRLTSA